MFIGRCGSIVLFRRRLSKKTNKRKLKLKECKEDLAYCRISEILWADRHQQCWDMFDKRTRAINPALPDIRKHLADAMPTFPKRAANQIPIVNP